VTGATFRDQLRRDRLQQLVRSLETLCRIFLKENYDWLWNIFEQLKR
jgi:hypothetical protein